MNLRSKSIEMMVKVILVLCVAAFTWPVVVHAEPCSSPTWPSGCDCGSLGDQLVLTCLPGNFNGTLIVYAHGYVYPQEPLALPEAELEDTIPIIQTLLNLGFGFATTSYSVNGYAVQQAEEDLNELVAYFDTDVAPVLKVLLVGASEGGLITTMMLEKYPPTNPSENGVYYDGGLALCGPIGGMPYQLNYVGDFRVVFDYFFPWVFPVGLNESNDVFYDTVCTKANPWDNYIPVIEQAIRTRPLRTLRLFDIADAAFDLFDASSFADTAETVLKYGICGINDLVDEDKAKGMPYDNQSTWYDASWWLNLRVERVAGDPVAQQYVADFYQTTGELDVPLVTLHNISDPAVPYRHEEIYKKLVAQKGKSGNLTVWPVLGYGHCNFKPWQVLGAFYILLNQVNN